MLIRCNQMGSLGRPIFEIVIIVHVCLHSGIFSFSTSIFGRDYISARTTLYLTMKISLGLVIHCYKIRCNFVESGFKFNRRIFYIRNLLGTARRTINQSESCVHLVHNILCCVIDEIFHLICSSLFEFAQN